MTEQPTIINDWWRIYDQLLEPDRVILRQTLPTPSLIKLMELYATEFSSRLKTLDTTKSDTEFKERYKNLRYQQDLAEGFINFVKSINT